MKKLLICALCALAACQSERQKISKDQLFDITGKYVCVIGRATNIQAARLKSGKWLVFVPDSALENLYQSNIKNGNLSRVIENDPPKQNRLIDTVLCDVWVSSYTNRTFIVATASVRLWSNELSAKDYFYCNHNDDCAVGADIGTYASPNKRREFKKILSKPVTSDKIQATKKLQFDTCAKYIDRAKIDEIEKHKLDSIALVYSKH